MNIKLKLFELCDYALISQDNKLSIIGIFNQIYVQSLPARHPKIVIAVVAEGEPDSEHTIRFQIKSPSGDTVTKQPSDLKMKIGPSGRSNVLVEIGNTQFSTDGEHVVQCFIDNKKTDGRILGVVRLSERYGQPKAPGKPIN